jgi:hypothetical protein
MKNELENQIKLSSSMCEKLILMKSQMDSINLVLCKFKIKKSNKLIGKSEGTFHFLIIN